MLFRPFALLTIALTASHAVEATSTFDIICDDTFRQRTHLGRIGDFARELRGYTITWYMEAIHEIAKKLHDASPVEKRDDTEVIGCYIEHNQRVQRALSPLLKEAYLVYETKPQVKAAIESWKLGEIELYQQIGRLLPPNYARAIESMGLDLERDFNTTISKY
ncbi:hypothetical protein PT974_10763 [Cladobotryum mycophilum]|uniref:Uncharacterized protein n=1 Tax=Cladobotryum mycophilum TaxID=491253 RepID=A0ABR0SAR6_9HYPO